MLPSHIEEQLIDEKNTIANALCHAFIKCNSDIFSGNYFTHEVVHLSGSTCCSVLFYGNTVYCANSGDSRAILVAVDKSSGNLIIKELSRDHKPSDLLEKERIESIGGVVDTFKDERGQDIGPS